MIKFYTKKNTAHLSEEELDLLNTEFSKVTDAYFGTADFWHDSFEKYYDFIRDQSLIFLCNYFQNKYKPTEPT